MHDLLQRAAAAVDFVQHQRERVLDGRHAGRRCRVGLLLFFERVRGVVGGDHLQAAVAQCLPQSLVVVARFQRRIHLHERAEPRVVVDVEQQMMRARFAGDEAAMIGQQLRLGAGRNVQHVKAMMMPVGEIDGPPRGDDRRLVIANSRVIGHVASCRRAVRRWPARSFRPRNGR